MEYLLTLGISLVLAAIDTAIKNPEKRATLRRVMTKMRDGLLVAYPPDTYGIGSSRILDDAFEPGVSGKIITLTAVKERTSPVVIFAGATPVPDETAKQSVSESAASDPRRRPGS